MDFTFGKGGKVTTEFGNFNGAECVAVEADGKVLVAGSVDNGSHIDFACRVSRRMACWMQRRQRLHRGGHGDLRFDGPDRYSSLCGGRRAATGAAAAPRRERLLRAGWRLGFTQRVPSDNGLPECSIGFQPSFSSLFLRHVCGGAGGWTGGTGVETIGLHVTSAKGRLRSY